MFRLPMEEEPSLSSPIAKDAIGDDAWNWRDDDWSSYLRVKNRVAQALSCYGEVPDEMLEESKEPSEEDLRIADLAAVTPAARGGGSFEDSDDENADGTADALEARARMFTPACRALPKVELHAHLNGCVRDRTLLEFAQSDDRPAGDALPTTLASLREKLARGSTPGDGRGRPRPLSECFELFGAIHALCTDHARIARVAAEAVVDFARDGVVYLELRTTPKDLEARGVSKESYCEAVLRGMALGSHVARKAAPVNAAFVARLILSVDRRESVAEAKRTVRLAAYLRDTDCGVVGVDLSGDPSVGSFAKLEPALRLARKNGLPVTLHCGEAANARGEEAAMLRFKPERLGHCVFTTRDETLWAQLRASKIPVELCITSNVVTDSVDAEGGVESTPTKKSASTSAASAAARHHLTKVHGAGHPFVLATDDPGVFDTSLSREYALAAASCGLRSEDLRRIARDAFEYAFVHAHEAMNEEDAERAAGDVAKVRAALDAGTRAWPGLPAVTAADAIRESATKRASATKRRITSATREVTRRINLFKDAVADLADVAAENDAVVEENGGDDETKDEVTDDGERRERHAGSGTGAATSRDARVSKWSVVRAVVGGADEDEAPARSSLRFGDVVDARTLGRSVARMTSMTKQSKKAAAATVALALLRPGSGDRADAALRSFARRVAPLLRPGAGDLRADARKARRFLVELGFLDARAAEESAHEDENEAYERLVREAETNSLAESRESIPQIDSAEDGTGTPGTSRVENDTTTDTLSLLRRVGRARRRRAARLRRRSARRRVVLRAERALLTTLRNAPLCALVACAALGNWPFLLSTAHGGDGASTRSATTRAVAERLVMRHAAALVRVARAAFAFFARDGAGGTLPTAESARALIATHVACAGAAARAAGTFAATGANGVVPTPGSAARLAAAHARLLSRAARGAVAAAFGGAEVRALPPGSPAPPARDATEGDGRAKRTLLVIPNRAPAETGTGGSGASSSSSSSRERFVSSSGELRERPSSGGGPRRPRHVELVAAADGPSRESVDLLRWDSETPTQE